MGYYEELDIAYNASQEEIKTAYRKKAKLYHPDKNASSSAAKRFLKVQEAYDVLSDPQKRKQYDLMLAYYGVSYTNYQRRQRRRRNAGAKKPKKDELEFTEKAVSRGYVMCIIGFLFVVLLVFDFLSPPLIVKQVVTARLQQIGFSESEIIKTTDYKFPINFQISTEFISPGKIVYLELTPTFHQIRRIRNTKQDKRIYPHYGIFNTFLFFPILILIISSNGIFFENKDLYIVNSGLVNSILIFLTVLMMLL